MNLLLSPLRLLPLLVFLAACEDVGKEGPGGTAGSPSVGGSGGLAATPGGAPAGAGTSGASLGGGGQSTGGSLGAPAGAGGSLAVAGSSGSVGVSGSAGLGGAEPGSGGAAPVEACTSRKPTAAMAGVNFPFPQRRFSSSCTYPVACSDEDVRVGWQNFKARLIVDGGEGTLRVQRPEFDNDTVSEGIAYGMLFAAYMHEKETFDKIWGYAKRYFDDNGLMHWKVSPDGNVTGANSATDSDEDMAFALIMADEQWGGYAEETKGFLSRIADHDFHDDGTIKGGDSYGEVNPSYLAPAFYRTFAKFTGDSRWNTILDKSYDILNGAANATTGLVPDWSSGDRGRNYTYDAARTPYRIALDACWNNEPRAKAYVEKVGAFFAGVGVDNIRDGYTLDGMLLESAVHKNSTFIAPAGTAGMVGGQVKLIDDAYAFVAKDLQEGTENYYNLSWALFTAMMMTGNFVDLTAY